MSFECGDETVTSIESNDLILRSCSPLLQSVGALRTLDSPPDGKGSPTQWWTTRRRDARTFMVLSDVVHWNIITWSISTLEFLVNAQRSNQDCLLITLTLPNAVEAGPEVRKMAPTRAPLVGLVKMVNFLETRYGVALTVIKRGHNGTAPGWGLWYTVLGLPGLSCHMAHQHPNVPRPPCIVGENSMSGRPLHHTPRQIIDRIRHLYDDGQGMG